VSKEKVLHDFGNLPDDAGPDAGLIFDSAGNLYGTTRGGGGSQFSADSGTVFELTPGTNGTWTETVLYNFCSLSACTDGAYPEAGLILDGAGNLYGTTQGGGSYSSGTVFRLAPGRNGTWSETVLHSFNSGDGGWPFAGMIFDGAGNLYGTTYSGGSHGDGTVFQLTPRPNGTWSETVLHSFDGEDGKYPTAGLIFDSAGNLYGTTTAGGNLSDCSGFGCGVVFRLTPNSNRRWREKVLHGFNGRDGASPSAGLIFDETGNLYSTTPVGGNHQCGGPGCGVVFQLTPATNDKWSEKVLHVFDGNHGTGPLAALILDKAGNLYGTTFAGGLDSTWCSYPNGCGTVFELTPGANGTWIETVLYRFPRSGLRGNWPLGGLVPDVNGNLYGTTTEGGKDIGVTVGGTVFEITP
jgi:uncharacterized repeat protein (TIGR03803 family)